MTDLDSNRPRTKMVFFYNYMTNCDGYLRYWKYLHAEFEDFSSIFRRAFLWCAWRCYPGGALPRVARFDVPTPFIKTHGHTRQRGCALALVIFPCLSRQRSEESWCRRCPSQYATIRLPIPNIVRSPFQSVNLGGEK